MSGQKIGHYDEYDKAALYYRVVDEVKNMTVSPEEDGYRYLAGTLPQDMSGLSVLDVGGGNGQWSELFCRRGARRVLLFDKSPAMVEFANRRKSVRQLERLEIRNISLEDYIQATDEKFDIVFSSYSLMYFQDISTVMMKLCGLLNANGQLLVMTNNFIPRHGTAPLEVPAGMVIPLAFGENEKIHFETLYQPAALYLQGIEMSGMRAVNLRYFPDNPNSIEPFFDNRYGLKIRQLVISAQK
ncbi:MAG: class I SAM-dependent methyltransferase [Bacillota bacterium]